MKEEFEMLARQLCTKLIISLIDDGDTETLKLAAARYPALIAEFLAKLKAEKA